MLKLLTLLSSVCFISVPAQQVYHGHKNLNPVKKIAFQEEATEIKEVNSNPEVPLGGGSADTVGRQGTIKEIAQFDHLIPNWQWFTKLGSESALGYTDLDPRQGSSGTGLCEYISMAMLLQYQELFVSSGLFTDDEWDKWFINDKDKTKVNPPRHSYYDRNEPEKGLVRYLYQTINKKDLKFSKDVANAFTKFLKGKKMSQSVKQAKSASFMHSSFPSDYIKKQNVPVMVSFVSPMAHNITLFGYNSSTDELAFNIGWPGSGGKNSMRIVKQSSFWSFWSFGFWNTIYIPDNVSKNPPRKAFLYKENKYSWEELEAEGIDWDDIKDI